MNLIQVLDPSSQIQADATSFCTDTRQLSPGSIFVAIRGEQFDGHDFLQEAQARGAVAAVVSHKIESSSLPQIVVADTVQALAQVAMQHRQRIHCPTIALTGSNGKTTVKEMIAAILPKPSHATKGNLNNHLGAPLSVLALKTEHRYAVFELGANHAGEIAHTVAIVRPDVTLINNIAPAHIEGFGSVDGVAHAKGEIHQGLSPEGVAVINEDDSYAHFWDGLLKGKKVLGFSSNKKADIYLQNLTFDAHGCGHFTLITPEGQEDIALQVPGRHNVQNALAAAACCYALGIAIKDIRDGLNQFGGVKGRMTFLQGMNQATVIDDTYNANPASVSAALSVLAHLSGRKILVLGDMGELGVGGADLHRKIGEEASRAGIEKLLALGELSVNAVEGFGKGAMHFSNIDELLGEAEKLLDHNVTMLVKGSRFMKMERVIQRFEV